MEQTVSRAAMDAYSTKHHGAYGLTHAQLSIVDGLQQMAREFPALRFDDPIVYDGIGTLGYSIEMRLNGNTSRETGRALIHHMYASFHFAGNEVDGHASQTVRKTDWFSTLLTGQRYSSSKEVPVKDWHKGFLASVRKMMETHHR